MFLFLTNSRRRAHKNSQTGPCGCFSRSFRLSPRLCGYFLAGLFSALLWGATPAQAQTCTGPDGNAGDVLYNDSVGMFQGCTLRGWMAFHNPTTPPDCPNIGDTCSDGTVYAGTYGGGRLYVTAADAPGTVVTGARAAVLIDGMTGRPVTWTLMTPRCRTARRSGPHAMAADGQTSRSRLVSARKGRLSQPIWEHSPGRGPLIRLAAIATI